MRPHRLRFAGIGPYPGLVELDFDELSALGLYLVIGPTGAGKTTIFDAITFALYGRVAGERPETRIASDHDHRQLPFVELDFSHRDRYYRVHRRPLIDDKPPKPSEIRFTEFADKSYTDSDNTITGVNAVSRKVTELIGLDATQFMRVMLLPQNEFQQFLLANSTEKETLLRALFGTNLFEQIALQMVDSAKSLRKEAEAKQQDLDNLRFVVREVVDTLEASGLAHDLPDPDDALAELITVVSELVDTAKAKQAETGKRSTSAIEAATKAEHDAERFDAAATIKDVERETKLLAPKVTDATKRLLLDERAGRAALALEARDQAQSLADQSQGLAVSARRALVEELRVRVDAPVLTPLRGAAPSAAPSELTIELTAAVERLDNARTHLRSAADAEDEAQRHANLEKLHHTTATQAGKKATALAGELKVTKARVVATKKLAKGFAKLDRELGELEQLLVAADVTGTRTSLKVAQTSATSAKTAFDKADAALAAARNARTKHLAGELALTLVEGEECPVCGSTEHPRKAQPTADQDVNGLEAERDRMVRVKAEAERQLKDAQDAAEVAMKAAAKLLPAPEQKVLRKNHRLATEASEQLEELEESLEEVALQLVTEEKRRDGALKDGKAAEQHRKTFQAQKDQHSAAAQLIVGEAAVELVQEVLDRAKACLTSFVSATHQHVTASGKCDHAKVNAEESLKREGFAKELDVAKATLDEAQRQALQTLLDDDATRKENLTHLRGVVGTEAPPLKRPDVAGLAAAKVAAQAAHSAASEVASRLANALASLQKQRKLIAKLGPDVDWMVERAKRCQYIASVVHRGQDPLLGLERWVQRAVFEEVCDVASEQIRALSHGRYVLTLESSGKRSRTRAAGLDLYVTDSHTGRTRAVQSLSGGEQFLTSLALALALAEVVQNRSGGIELSTLFIDEGFGSLDGDTLDTALEVLRSLQDSGRTVGLISHVEAMRQEITVGIQVVPDPAGSSLKVLSSAA